MQNVLHFEEAKLLVALSGISRRRRSLFAAMIATRLLPSFEAYAIGAKAPGIEELRSALDHLWVQIEKESATEASSEETNNYIQTVISLIPDEDDGNRLAAQADDAASALAYALRSLNDPNPQEAAWAARTAYDSADNLVISRDDVKIGGSAEEAILQDPLIQSELCRQREDLGVATSSALSPAFLMQLRQSCLDWGNHFYVRA
jgi:Protein of unknown function (DUF416)